MTPDVTLEAVNVELVTVAATLVRVIEDRERVSVILVGVSDRVVQVRHAGEQISGGGGRLRATPVRVESRMVRLIGTA